MATWLSIVPGLGQVYNRQPKRAAVFFVGVVALLVVTLNIPGATSQLLAAGETSAGAVGPATVTTINADRDRNTRIAQLTFPNGEKRYIIAPPGMEVGQRISGGSESGTAGSAPLGLLLEIISLLLFMTTFLAGFLLWYDAMHDARRTAQEVYGEREPAGRWWWFHR